ncbi:MAG TPA: hypothetical protein VGH11_03820 [Jatrophihabitans sp.]|jgi:hypothetical protein
MPINTDVRSYADTALEQGKTVLTHAGAIVTTANKRLSSDAAKPAYAALGAADFVAATITKRIEALPADAAANFAKVQETSKARITRAQGEAIARIGTLRGKVDARIDEAKSLRDIDVPSTAVQIGEGYLSIAKTLYDSFTTRGEAKASELRKDPRVAKLLGEISDVANTVESTISPVIDSVVQRVESTTAAVKPARKAQAAKSTARKAPAKKATAAKSTAAKSTATRSTATKSARKSPAKKATPSA